MTTAHKPPADRCPACHWPFPRRLKQRSEQGWIITLYGPGNAPRVVVVDIREIQNFPKPGEVEEISTMFSDLVSGERRDGVVHECVTTIN